MYICTTRIHSTLYGFHPQLTKKCDFFFLVLKLFSLKKKYFLRKAKLNSDLKVIVGKGFFYYLVCAFFLELLLLELLVCNFKIVTFLTKCHLSHNFHILSPHLHIPLTSFVFEYIIINFVSRSWNVLKNEFRSTFALFSIHI